MERYPPTFKERVVREYQPRVRGKGFNALVKRFKLCKSLVETWWKNGMLEVRLDAFAEEAGGDRRSALTEREKQRHILNFVSHQNAKRKAVDYTDVTKNVRKKVKRVAKMDEKVLHRIVQRVGKEELNLSWKQTINTLESDESQDYKETVARISKKMPTSSKGKIDFS